jgi:hypothetical protein
MVFLLDVVELVLDRTKDLPLRASVLEDQPESSWRTTIPRHRSPLG